MPVDEVALEYSFVAALSSFFFVSCVAIAYVETKYFGQQARGPSPRARRDAQPWDVQPFTSPAKQLQLNMRTVRCIFQKWHETIGRHL
jgi:hypothetical protein